MQLDYETRCAQAAKQLEDVTRHEDITADAESEEQDDLDPNQGEGDVLADIGCYTNVRHHKDGLFSTVYKASGPQGQVVALKVTFPSAMVAPHDAEREARILRRSSHAHIIPLLDDFHLSGGRFVLVFPFQSTNLEELLDAARVPEADAKSYLYDLFDALDYLHSQGYIHRDIKPSNILVRRPSERVYLADFGIAWSLTDKASEPVDRKITDVGTTSYRPPELLFGHTAYDSALDMWAAGCVVAEVVASLKGPLFDSGPLGSELALIRSIFSALGTPDEQTWPVCCPFKATYMLRA